MLHTIKHSINVFGCAVYFYYENSCLLFVCFVLGVFFSCWGNSILRILFNNSLHIFLSILSTFFLQQKDGEKWTIPDIFERHKWVVWNVWLNLNTKLPIYTYVLKKFVQYYLWFFFRIKNLKYNYSNIKHLQSK